MKNRLIKKVLSAATLFIALGFTNTASAHDYGDTLKAGVSPTYWGGQTDVWKITCPAGQGADHLVVSIINKAPKKIPIVSFAAYKSGIPGVVRGETDPIDYDTSTDPNYNPYSKEAIIPGGTGDYYIIVKKTEGKTTAASTPTQRAAAVAAQSYSIAAHCATAGGDHTNLDDQFGSLKQNQ